MADPRIWHAHIARDLERLTAGLLDLIDCGLPTGDTDVRLRRPSDEEVEQTRRGEDTDADYSIPAGPSGRSFHISDPTGSETVRWTHAVANALADVDTLISDWRPDAARVVRQGGTTVPPPPAPVDLTEDDDGRIRATIHPARARRATFTRVRWLMSAAAAIVDRWEHETDPDLIAFWDDRTHALRHQAHGTALRHGRHEQDDVRCLNPLGRTNHPLDAKAQGGICSDCLDPKTCRECGDLLPLGHDRRDCWSCVNARRFQSA